MRKWAKCTKPTLQKKRGFDEWGGDKEQRCQGDD